MLASDGVRRVGVGVGVGVGAYINLAISLQPAFRPIDQIDTGMHFPSAEYIIQQTSKLLHQHDSNK